jgi:proteasome lid subunit RPN8/RPN11
MTDEIRIRAEVLEEMIRHARSEQDMECCGLLAGRNGVITKCFTARNALASRSAYEIAPLELFRLFRRMRDEGLDHLGLYHSHPYTENFPSPRDIDQANYPNEVYFIVSPRDGAARPVRAFLIRIGEVRELKIETAVV